MLARKLAHETEMFLAWWEATKSASDAESRLGDELAMMFDDVAKAIINKLNKMRSLPSSDSGRQSLVALLKNVKSKFKDTVFSHAAEAAADAQRVARIHMGVKPGEISQVVLGRLKDKVFEAMEQTMNRIVGDVMGGLTDSYSQGLGIDKGARNLREQFDGIKDWEAKRIARTEINSAQSGVAHQVIEDHASYRQWIAAEDDRVRDGSDGGDDHAYLHGQIVRVGDHYSNGLMYPGDTSGPIENWINCRCREVAFNMPADAIAPAGLDYFYEGDLVEAPKVKADTVTVEVA